MEKMLDIVYSKLMEHFAGQEVDVVGTVEKATGDIYSYEYNVSENKVGFPVCKLYVSCKVPSVKNTIMCLFEWTVDPLRNPIVDVSEGSSLYHGKFRLERSSTGFRLFTTCDNYVSIVATDLKQLLKHLRVFTPAKEARDA